ncbi:hypothetical protein UVIVOLLU_CDS0001 [Salmonella phage PHA46_2]
MSQQHYQQSEPPKPSAWCEQMERNAKDGDEAYTYFQLKQMWRRRNTSPITGLFYCAANYTAPHTLILLLLPCQHNLPAVDFFRQIC